MFQAILYKEFLKIKYIFLSLLFLSFASCIYLYFDIIKSFHAIEPHSMLWYEAIFIGNIYFKEIILIPVVCAITIAFAQFLPEIQNKKFRIPLHLPLNQNKLVLFYLFVGLFLLTILNSLFSFTLYFVSLSFYPQLIASSALLSTLPYIISSYLIYIAIVSVLIEPYWKRKSIILIVFVLLSSMLYLNKNFESYNEVILFYSLILFLSLFIPLLSLYRFKNGDVSFEKTNSLISKISLYIFILLTFISFSYFLPKTYEDIIKDDSLATYVFYSSKDKSFVYKKHFGDHNFKYGNSNSQSFTQKQFEEALPFVFYRNLAIQKKLPIIIDEISYSKNDIKKARQSFKFDYRDINENKKQIDLYPLFNPKSNIGMIAFPNFMFNLDKKFLVLNSEENSENKELSSKYTKVFKDNNFLFPAKLIEGKTTNIKPLDEGYFILDSKNDLFHVKIYDDEMIMKKISYDKNIKIKDIKISESRKKEFYGLLLSQKNEVYIIHYDKYKFTKLKLEEFNPYKAKLEIYADPINKLIRFKQDKKIYAYVYDKEFNYIDRFSIDIPQVNPSLITIYEYIFPFVLKKNEFKTLESYSLEFHQKSLILYSILAFLYFLISRKNNSLQKSITNSILILIGGIYSLIFITFL